MCYMLWLKKMVVNILKTTLLPETYFMYLTRNRNINVRYVCGGDGNRKLPRVFLAGPQ